MNVQDVESLGWSFVREQDRQTASGESRFNLYVGTVSFDSQEITIPVLAGREINEVLIGLPWLENRLSVVDRKVGLLTLGEE